MDESQVERTTPGGDVVHNEYHIRVHQQKGEDAKEYGRCQECPENLRPFQHDAVGYDTGAHTHAMAQPAMTQFAKTRARPTPLTKVLCHGSIIQTK